MGEAIDIFIRASVTIAAIILLMRLHGLRTFSKMSGFDFAITVAFGSVLAGAITTPKTGLWVYVVALAALGLVQWALAQSRARNERVRGTLDNPPLLVMKDGEAIEANLVSAGMTHDDLWAKLREANAFDLSTVHAVIVESTGDVSVLHGPADGPRPDAVLMSGVRGST